jgi:hypothetical protein
MTDILEKAKNYDWLLCIFFSVDIEGATAYKITARNQADDSDWCDLFEDFYTGFSGCFYKAYRPFSLSSVCYTVEQLRPTLWKSVGDEILFYSIITDSVQTLAHVYAFRRAIINYNKILQKYGVQCKGTAWIAGFPVNNRIVLAPNKNDNDPLLIDFLGSSIDAGFRLTKFSSPRKLVVSLDLLWLFAESALVYMEEGTDDSLTSLISVIKYAGQHELKGVFSGKKYPIFWLDTCIIQPVEDTFLSVPHPCDLQNIVTFCEEFSPTIDSAAFIRPFINNDPSKRFDKIPKSFDRRRQRLIAYKKQEVVSCSGLEEKVDRGLSDRATIDSNKPLY